jgi:predicted ATPase
VGDPPQLSPTLFGLYAVYLVRGEFRTAHELAERMLRHAQSGHNQRLLMNAHLTLGATSFWMGELLLAREHLEIAISLYPERHRPLAPRHGGIDVGVNCLLYAAWTLWHLGYFDQALKRGNQALAFAEAMSHPHNLAYTKYFVGVLHQFRREPRAAQEHAEGVISLSAEHGLIDWLAWATIVRGSVFAEQGRNEEGITQMQEGLAASRATGTEVNRPYFLTLLAEACMETDRLDEAERLDGSAGRRG